MKSKLSDFLNLNESLDTVAEFYMTQDTDIPNRIVAGMKWDNTDYVLNLEKSTKEGLYTMSLGMVVSKNLGYFRFKNTAHIRTILNTTMKALEASVPFLGQNIKGLAISLPAKVSKSYLDLMKLLIQKTYLKNQFEFLPVEHVGASHQYLLLVRKGVNPQLIFKTKTFKDYGFNDKYTKSTPVPSDALDTLGPVKPHTASYNMAPSKKYTFKDYEVDNITVDNVHKLIDAKPVIDKLVKKDIPEKEKEEVVAPSKKIDMDAAQKENHENVKKTHMQLITAKDVTVVIPNMSNEQMKYYENLVALAFGDAIFIGLKDDAAFQAWYKSFGGLDQKKLALKKMCKLNIIETLLNKLGYVTATAKNLIFNAVKELEASKIFEDFSKITEDNLDHIMKWGYWRYKKYIFTQNHGEVYDMTYGHNVYTKPSVEKTKPMTNGENTNVDRDVETLMHKSVDIDMEMPVIESQKNFLNSHQEVRGIKKDYNEEDGYQYEKVVDDLINSPAYQHIIKKKSTDEFTAVWDYTGGSYRPINNVTRNSFNDDQAEFDVSPGTYGSQVKGIQKMFNEAPPLEHGLWVMRNTKIPNIELPDGAYDINTEIVDPGFLSTSVRHGVFQYKDDNTHFKIYIPKGSKVLPVVTGAASDNDHEKEVILPAFSILRPIDIKVVKYTKAYSHDKNYMQIITCVYVGNAMNSYIDKKGKKATMESLSFKRFRQMTEETKKSADDKIKKNDNGKTGEQMFDPKVSAKIMKMIKDGKLKVEK